MEWVKLAIEFMKVLAWPLVALIIAIMFKRQFSDLTRRVTKAKLPGGFEFEVEALKKSLENEAPGLRTISANPHQIIGKLEKAVIKLAQHSLGVGIDLGNYDRNKVLENLENSKRISSEESRNIKKLFSILESDQITKASTKELEEAMLAVYVAIARLEEIYNVEVLCYEFQANGVWHYRESCDDKIYSEKYHFWSAIAAEAPIFNYSYEAFLEAAERHNKKEQKYRVYIPSRSEFVQILEFRKRELERYVNDYQNVEKWVWPDQWGPVIWNCPIVREGGANKALREIVDTKLAIQFYQGKNA